MVEAFGLIVILGLGLVAGIVLGLSLIRSIAFLLMKSDERRLRRRAHAVIDFFYLMRKFKLDSTRVYFPETTEYVVRMERHATGLRRIRINIIKWFYTRSDT